MKKIILFLTLAFIFAQNAIGAISPATFKNLQIAQEHIEKGELKEAKAILTPILNSKLNAASKSYALQSLANIAIEQEKYEDAAKYYEEIINFNAFSPKDIEMTKLYLSQIYISMEKYSKSIALLEKLLSSRNIEKKMVYENLAIAYYYSKDYINAIKYSKMAIELSTNKEQYYRILYSSYVEQKDYKNAIKTLRIMIKLYPTKSDYWLQLVWLYQTTEQFKDALAAMELAYKKNVIDKEKHTIYFVSILLNNNLYNKAGLVLEDAINKKFVELNKENFDTLISSFLNAKNNDKSINLLKTSKFAKTEKYQLILGDIYYRQNDCKNTIKTLSAFDFKEDLKYDGQRSILIAVCSHELDDSKTALKYFKKASKNKHEKQRATSLAKNLGYKI